MNTAIMLGLPPQMIKFCLAALLMTAWWKNVNSLHTRKMVNFSDDDSGLSDKKLAAPINKRSFLKNSESNDTTHNKHFHRFKKKTLQKVQNNNRLSNIYLTKDSSYQDRKTARELVIQEPPKVEIVERPAEIETEIVNTSPVVVKQPTSVIQAPTEIIQNPTTVVQAQPSVVQASPTVLQAPSPTIVQAPPPLVQAPSTVTQEATALVQAPPPIIQAPSTVTQEAAPLMQAPSPVIQAPSTVTQSAAPLVQAPPPVIQAPSTVTQGAAPLVQPPPPVIQAPSTVAQTSPGLIQTSHSSTALNQAQAGAYQPSGLQQPYQYPQYNVPNNQDGNNNDEDDESGEDTDEDEYEDEDRDGNSTDDDDNVDENNEDGENDTDGDASKKNDNDDSNSDDNSNGSNDSNNVGNGNSNNAGSNDDNQENGNQNQQTSSSSDNEDVDNNNNISEEILKKKQKHKKIQVRNQKQYEHVDQSRVNKNKLLSKLNVKNIYEDPNPGDGLTDEKNNNKGHGGDEDKFEAGLNRKTTTNSLSSEVNMGLQKLKKRQSKVKKSERKPLPVLSEKNKKSRSKDTRMAKNGASKPVKPHIKSNFIHRKNIGKKIASAHRLIANSISRLKHLKQKRNHRNKKQKKVAKEINEDIDKVINELDVPIARKKLRNRKSKQHQKHKKFRA